MNVKELARKSVSEKKLKKKDVSEVKFKKRNEIFLIFDVCQKSTKV